VNLARDTTVSLDLVGSNEKLDCFILLKTPNLIVFCLIILFYKFNF